MTLSSQRDYLPGSLGGRRATAPHSRESLLWLTVIALLLVLGTVAAVSMSVGRPWPTQLSVLASALCFALGWHICRFSCSPLVPRLGILLYSLPFSVTVVYLVDPQSIWWSTPHMRFLLGNVDVVRTALAIGFVGLVGLVAGTAITSVLRGSRSPSRRRRVLDKHQNRSFTLPVFLIVDSIALFLSWLYMPRETIFTMAYADPSIIGRYSTVNFNGAALLSYLLLVLLFVDAQASRNPARRRKMWIVLVSTAVIVVLFQLLQGNRDSIGLLTALLALWITGRQASGGGQRRSRLGVRGLRGLTVRLSVGIVLALFIVIGSLRSTLSQSREVHMAEALVDGARNNTWTYVLHTNVAMAATYLDGGDDLLWGRTYIDYVLSLPPSVVAHVLDYQRPQDGKRAPAKWFQSLGVTNAGMHIVNVPFRNFGIWGTFVILSLVGSFLVLVSDRGCRGGSFDRLLYGSVVAAMYRWFWYGEISLIRALMGALVLGAIYEIYLRYRLLPVMRSPLGWIRGEAV